MEWTDIPADILDSIANRLDSYNDYKHCREVCKTWKLELPKIPREQKLCQALWMVLPNIESKDTPCCFVNLSEKQTYYLNLPKSQTKFVVGSCSGWLFIIEDHRLYLLNPFTRSNVNLPPLTAFSNTTYCPISDCYSPTNWPDTCHIEAKYYIRKVIICRSSNSSIGKDDFAVVVIRRYINDLGYFKPGDKIWNEIPMPFYVKDAIFHEGSLYAISYCDRLGVVNNIMGISPKGIEIHVESPPPEPPSYIRHITFLVSSNYDLLLVKMSYEPKYLTLLFRVFKLEGSNWSTVNSLGDQVLLLGDNRSMLVPCHIFPGSKGNCIYYDNQILYYQHHRRISELDVRVFHLDTNTEENLHDTLDTLDLKKVINMSSTQAIWLFSDLSAEH